MSDYENVQEQKEVKAESLIRPLVFGFLWCFVLLFLSGVVDFPVCVWAVVLGVWFFVALFKRVRSFEKEG